MKPIPPCTCTPVDVTSIDISVDQPFTIGTR
jgi:hypothetical protein